MKKHIVAILAAGTLWGFMGLFVRGLGEFGISSSEAVLVRCSIAALAYAVTILLKDRNLFRIKLKDLWCFIGSGLCALFFFMFCYFKSMEYLDLSTAATLLYTAPIIVVLLSRLLFGEKLSKLKLAALALSFLGTCLVSGIGNSTKFPPAGILLGLCSGLGYALYSIFARFALNRGYGNLTINFYSMLLSAAGCCFVWNPAHCLKAGTASVQAAVLCLAMGILISYLPYLLYTYGMRKAENGRASIMASVEPLVATLVGILIYKEPISAMSIIGIVLVFSSLILINIKPNKN